MIILGTLRSFFFATKAVPVDSAALSPDESDQSADNTCQVVRRANTGTCNQGPLRVRRRCSLNLRWASSAFSEIIIKQKPAFGKNAH